MTRKSRIHYELETGEITSLKPEELRAILRAADEAGATGGRVCW